MKTSVPRQLALFCSVALALLNSFQIGAYYAASPYRALLASVPTRLEYTQIAVQQSHTLLLVSSASVCFSFLALGFLLYARFQKKPPVRFPDQARFARESL